MIDPVRHFIGIRYIKKINRSYAIVQVKHGTLAYSQMMRHLFLNMIKHPELAEASRYSE
jgi:hypothetical protein